MIPSRAIPGLLFALAALLSALDSYAAHAVPGGAGKSGYAQHSCHANTALTPVGPSVGDDDDDESPRSGKAPDPLLSEPLAPIIFVRGGASIVKARPAGQTVQHPPCAVPQTGPPRAHATA